MKYFDSVKDIIKDYSSENIKLLEECIETIKLLKSENEDGNPYILLAKNFEHYNNLSEKELDEEKQIDDWYFYKYLKSLGYNHKYSFPLKNGKTIEVSVDLFNPYYSKSQDLLNPQWHLLVSYYAYIDAAFNHTYNKYANKIKDKNGWTTRKPIRRKFSSKSLSTWLKEAKK